MDFLSLRSSALEIEEGKMTNWTKNQVETLISAIVEKPFLYDPKSKLYKHRNLRLLAMEEIAKKISEMRPNTTSEDCRKKWHSLRTNYAAEKRKVAKLNKNETFDTMYIPSLYYYKSMTFLDEYTHVRSSTPTFDEDEEEESFIVPLQDWDAEPGDDSGSAAAGVVKAEQPRDSPFPRAESPFRPAAAAASPQLAVAPSAEALPPPPEHSERRRRQGGGVVDEDGASVHLVGMPTHSWCEARSGEAPSEDVDGAFGRYIACRLRTIKCGREKAELMFKIEKLFYEHSQK